MQQNLRCMSVFRWEREGNNNKSHDYISGVKNMAHKVFSTKKFQCIPALEKTQSKTKNLIGNIKRRGAIRWSTAALTDQFS
jgi:hypothetical protein